MKYPALFTLLFLLISCQPKPSISWTPYDETAELAENADHPSRRLRYKLLQSRVIDKNTLWASIGPQLKGFSSTDYEQLKPLILDQDIFTMQKHVGEGELSYEKLTQWYLYRIALFENDKDKYLNAIISINPNAVARARELDKDRTTSNHPIYGMPVLLKDNVNFAGLPTTAGAHVLRNNMTRDAVITKQIKDKGGIILGKTNLSEWANFLCLGCPNGYSAVGGQTLNAYGRKEFDTGGSSSGSGAAMAANYAAAAVGTETSGSILSPSSQSSLVGLKPTIGVLSQDGIVPISSTLDTPGPMTRSVLDNAILLSAMNGKEGSATGSPQVINFWGELKEATVKGLRLGVNKNYLEDAEYAAALDKLRAEGAELFEFEPIEVDFDGFGDFLSADMAKDLPAYLKNFGDPKLQVATVADIVDHNLQETHVRIPYGQGRFAGILDLDLQPADYPALKKRLRDEGKRFLEAPMQEFKLDAILSINNYGAGVAAAAQYPCLTVPMGYTAEGKPKGLTFVGRQYTLGRLLMMGAAFERVSLMRVGPGGY
jgi:amidase